MPTLPIAEWTTALDQMAGVLTDLLSDLDRTITGWATPPEPSEPIKPTHPHLDEAQASFALWDERVTAAATRAASLEDELDHHAAALRRWRESFSRWGEFLKQGVSGPATFLG